MSSLNNRKSRGKFFLKLKVIILNIITTHTILLDLRLLKILV
jgi:hypothetical protein